MRLRSGTSTNSNDQGTSHASRKAPKSSERDIRTGQSATKKNVSKFRLGKTDTPRVNGIELVKNGDTNGHTNHTSNTSYLQQGRYEAQNREEKLV